MWSLHFSIRLRTVEDTPIYDLLDFLIHAVSSFFWLKLCYSFNILYFPPLLFVWTCMSECISYDKKLHHIEMSACFAWAEVILLPFYWGHIIFSTSSLIKCNRKTLSRFPSQPSTGVTHSKESGE